MLRLRNILSAVLKDPSLLIAFWTEAAASKLNLSFLCDAAVSRTKWVQRLLLDRLNDCSATMSDAANGACGDVSVSVFSAERIGVLQSGVKADVESISENGPKVNIKGKYMQLRIIGECAFAHAPTRRLSNSINFENLNFGRGLFMRFFD